MRTIYKYKLDYTRQPQEVLIPEGALFLTVQLQLGFITMWFEVDSTKEKEKRFFLLLETGEAIPPSCKAYLGTIQMQHGHAILHVYADDMSESGVMLGVKDYGNIIHLQPTGTA